jgi:uncharacterized LabA/DUF88 family protein
MDRFAIFVDAGYALAVGARIVCGRKVPRAGAALQHRAFIDNLVQNGRANCGLDLLRVYWYDGATDAMPTTEHQTLGELPNLKVRLGRLVNRGRTQKGVDTLIVLDLTTLARERAISTAFVMSGDEDLREGVAAAQQLGVRVVLWGLEPVSPEEPNQAITLIREADVHSVLDSENFIKPFFSPLILEKPSTARAEQEKPTEEAAVAEQSPRSVGLAFITEWLASGPPALAIDSLRQAKAQFPRKIPATIDAELLARGRAEVANPLSETQKRELRRGFWEGVT